MVFWLKPAFTGKEGLRTRGPVKGLSSPFVYCTFFEDLEMSFDGVFYHLKGFLNRIALRRAPGKGQAFNPVASVFRVSMENDGIFTASTCNSVFSLPIHIDHLPFKFLELPSSFIFAKEILGGSCGVSNV